MIPFTSALEQANRYLRSVKARPPGEVTAERALADKLRLVMEDVIEATLLKLEAAGVPSNEMSMRSILFNFEDAAGDIAEVTGDDAIEATKRGRNTILDTIRKLTGQRVLFDELPLTVINRVRESTFVASQRTMARLAGDIRGSLELAFNEGLGTQGARELLEGQFKSMQRFEMNRIARTEIQAFQNVGAQQTMEDLGVSFQQWITAGDSRVRDSHIDIEGEITSLSTTFSNGLRFPLDTAGPLEEWINCRCRAVPFIIDPEFAAPHSGPFFESELVPVLAAAENELVKG